MGIHFLALWPCGPISLHFGFFGVSFWAPPTSCQKWPVCPTSLQWIYQRRDRLHFAVFSLVGLHFLAFWPCGPSFPCILALWAFISLHFGLHFAVFSLVGLHFLAFWSCGPSFPCILALWAFISLHFGFFGVGFWGPAPHVAKNGLLPALALCTRPLSEIGFFACAPARVGFLPARPLPSANDPCLKWDFLLAPLPGMGVFPVKPLPSAHDPCLK